MFRADHTIMSRMIRMEGRMGNIHSFWAMYSLRMSACTVPERRLRSKPRLWARATYMARRIHAVGLMVMETEIVSRSTPLKRASTSSRVSTATPSRPTSPSERGSSES